MFLGIDRRHRQRRAHQEPVTTERRTIYDRRRREVRLVPYWKLRLAHTVDRFPVFVGMTIALIVATIALVLVITQQGRLSTALDKITHERISTTTAFCRAINQNAEANNRSHTVIADLIVAGAKQSAPFERLFRAYGFPPYAVRLRRAREEARSVSSLVIEHLNCRRLKVRVQRELNFG